MCVVRCVWVCTHACVGEIGRWLQVGWQMCVRACVVLRVCGKATLWGDQGGASTRPEKSVRRVQNQKSWVEPNRCVRPLAERHTPSSGGRKGVRGWGHGGSTEVDLSGRKTGKKWLSKKGQLSALSAACNPRLTADRSDRQSDRDCAPNPSRDGSSSPCLQKPPALLKLVERVERLVVRRQS